MKRVFSVFLLALWLTLSVGSVLGAPNNSYSMTQAVANVDTTITLPSTYNYVTIKTDVGAANVFFNLNGTTASTTIPGTDFKIDGGGGWTNPTKIPSITVIHYIGASATGNISVLAW